MAIGVVKFPTEVYKNSYVDLFLAKNQHIHSMDTIVSCEWTCWVLKRKTTFKGESVLKLKCQRRSLKTFFTLKVTTWHYVYLQNTIISFEYVDFWPKIYFVPMSWKIDNPYCHNLQAVRQTNIGQQSLNMCRRKCCQSHSASNDFDTTVGAKKKTKYFYSSLECAIDMVQD